MMAGQREDRRLALWGGSPVRREPFPSWPFFDDEEIENASRVLRSGRVNYWTGVEGPQFETEFARATDCRYGIALANGTVALELALRALEIGIGDEVLVTPRSFIASASTVIQCGAAPIFVDVDRDSQNVDPAKIEASVTDRTRAILLVHLAGWPCDMASYQQLAAKYDLRVIEDCAQAHGARYGGRPVGSFGDVAAFSFCQDKIMTTCGEGGMLVTNLEDLWRRAWAYKDHGKSSVAANVPSGAAQFRWLHDSIGSNYRMTEIQAAVGRIQLRKLSEWVERRRRHAEMLSKYFASIEGLRVTTPPAEVYHSYYKYYVFLREDKLQKGWDRDRVLEAIRAEGVPCYSGSCPEIYLEKAFDNTSARPSSRLPVAQELGRTSLMFVVHPTLTESDIHDTCEAVGKVLSVATK